MKTITSLLLFFIIGSAQSQPAIGQKPEKNVPVVVSAVFNDQYPSNDPVWFSSYRGRFSEKLVYEARFIFGNRYSSAFYSKEGNFIAFASAVNYNELPMKIREYMLETFPNHSILDSIFVTRSKGESTYEIGIIVDDQYVIKVFSEEGKFIKSTRL